MPRIALQCQCIAMQCQFAVSDSNVWRSVGQPVGPTQCCCIAKYQAEKVKLYCVVKVLEGGDGVTNVVVIIIIYISLAGWL